MAALDRVLSGALLVLHRRLAVDVPEFASWVQQTDGQATRLGLRRLEELLQSIASAQTPDRRRKTLALAYQAALSDPILRTADAPEHLVRPALGEIYVDPHFRVRDAGPGDRPSEEGWWAESVTRDDLPEFLAGYLNTERATQVPLVILGQPGATRTALPVD